MANQVYLEMVGKMICLRCFNYFYRSTVQVNQVNSAWPPLVGRCNAYQCKLGCKKAHCSMH